MVHDAVTSQALATEDGVTLEMLLDTPAKPRGTIVVCHPHPQHGGTMRAPILEAIAKTAVASAYAVLRFNFRGVGTSTGTFGGGVDELFDVAAAVSHAESLGHPVVGICGWSFGAATALNWQAASGSSLTYIGIAPPVDNPGTPKLPDPSGLMQARRGFIVGERDQFVDTAALEAYAASIDASCTVYPSADHFFVFRHDRLSRDVLRIIESET